MSKSLSAPPTSAVVSEFLTPLQLSAQSLLIPGLALAPRGQGQRVLVWPGFGASNASTLVLRNFLGFLGYRAQGWGLSTNNGDVVETLELLKQELAQVDEDDPVFLVGWSLGGYLAREAARDCPEKVKHVVTLGSPVVGGPKYTAVANVFAARGESIDEIEMAVEERYQVPLEVPVTAIYSKLDGVVAWQACIDERSPNVEHVEVYSSHVGLGFSPQALRIMANRLAAAA